MTVSTAFLSYLATPLGSHRNHLGVSLKPRGCPAPRPQPWPRRRSTLCASVEGEARESAVKAGSASGFPPELRALVEEQIANPIFYADSASVPAATAAAQRATPSRFLTDEECLAGGNGGVAASILRDNTEKIIRVAREAIVVETPSIEEEGGALWPAFRAEACWRDLENFVRVVSYGCVCVHLSCDEWLSPVGFSVMDKIYSALEVPRREMRIGLEAGGAFAVNELMRGDKFAESEREACQASFDALVAKLVAMPGGSAS